MSERSTPVPASKWFDRVRAAIVGIILFGMLVLAALVPFVSLRDGLLATIGLVVVGLGAGLWLALHVFFGRTRVNQTTSSPRPDRENSA